ncbi:MAG: tRNA epoxyqueuosine(34) reductase QueG [Saprospiraceae bacterium]|nr:tRNA epoxyqueuosine(34) reductase QueG [Saprospiraceae bacterium]
MANASLVKKELESLGFGQVGIVRSHRLDKEAKLLEEWLNRGNHGQMSYMERYFDLRVDPQHFLPGAKSVLMMSLNYFQDSVPENPKISRYAWGDDYHKVIRQKSKSIIQNLKNKYGDISIRGFVDSAPVMERVWAEKAGLGWNGKNTLTIHPRTGSWFFLAGFMTDLVFDHYDEPIRDHCGNCRRCIDACPTDAIHTDGYLLDASKCISYLTIELKEAIPNEFHPKMEGWMYGCDICQEVCPWNRFAHPSAIPEFATNQDLLQMGTSEWLDLSDDVWDNLTAKSPLKRAGLKKLKENVKVIANKN